MKNNFQVFDCRASLCFILFQLAFYVEAAADDLTPQQMVDRMSRATHELNYDGIFIYRHGRQSDTMRLIHKNGSNGEIERMVALTGHPREIIRNNKSVTCIFPDNKSVLVEKSTPYSLPMTQPPDSADKLNAYYRFSIAGHDRVAGNHATIVSVQPNDNYRYGYKLWIDNDNHLLLKSELKNQSGYPLEEIEFTKIDVVGSIADDMLAPAIASDGFSRFDNTARSASAQAAGNYGSWDVKWMPDGFTKSSHAKQPLSSSSVEVDHMVYTDGMAIISIFIEPIDNHSHFVPGLSRVGAVNAYIREANGFQVTAVGEVPPTTVEKMALSVINNH